MTARPRSWWWLGPCLCLFLLACGGGGSSGGGAPASAGAGGGGASGPAGPAAPAAPPAAIAGTTILMDYGPGGGFYDAPFPDESRRLPGGGIDLARFPNRGTNLFVEALASIAERDATGFGLTSGIFFRASDRLNVAALPSLDASVQRGSPVFLVSVDPGSPDYLRRYPVDVQFQDDGGPFGAPNLLSLVPLQGVPLREGALYAAAVLRGLGDVAGQPLGVSLSMAQVAARVPPAGLSPFAFQDHLSAIWALEQDGIDLREVAGLAVFRTGRPTEGLERFGRSVLARPPPQPTAPAQLVELQPEYCVLKTTIRLPVYQAGTPPFLAGGGGWQQDASGAPVRQGEEEADVFLTVPRRAMPAAGFPAAVVIRTGLGQGEKPIVDRTAYPNGRAGGGPALELAAAGFVGVQVDGPHGGRRNVSGLDEQLLIFNFANPLAMRDNLRQSALELALIAEVLPALTVDVARCPGVTTPNGGPVRIDPGTIALFGHSMGATIAPLALAIQPRYRGAILSGAGGSWIENVMFKERPYPILAAAELILGYPGLGRVLRRHDPVLSLLQWSGEPADPPAYARSVTREPRHGAPRHILMIQGIVDRYILPPIANATSLSLGLDLAGPQLDTGLPATPRFTPPLRDLFGHGGIGAIALPASGNRIGPGSAPYTAVVVQHPEDGIQDGHEVVFQTDPPKRQLRSFLETLAGGGPPVVP